MKHILIFLAALLLSPLSLLAADAPAILSASDPVRPDEAVLLTGDTFGEGCDVELAPVGAKQSETIKPIQTGARSLTFVVPKTRPQGIWECRVRHGELLSAPVVLNAPAVWWCNGDGGESASPGGWVRAFGKCLNFGAVSQAKLQSADGKSVVLGAVENTNYALKFSLPADLPAGDYALSVHNGLGGDEGWRSAGTITVRARATWKTDVFNVKDFGRKPAEALLAALDKAKANGGGVVYLPRGRYPVSGTLAIPPHTVLRGEAMELVSLYWPDFEKPPTELVTGGDYGLEGVSLYCQNHRDVVTDTALSQSFFLHHVRIRANCYFMIEDASREFRKRRGPASHLECGAALLLRGKNFEVTDCDIYASNLGLRIRKAKNGIFANNQLRYGGRGYSMENTDRLIFENNLIEGNNLLSIGNDITTFYTNYSRHIYYAHNHLRQMYGADREMMTLDAGGGAYFGKITSASGVHLTLADDPTFRDYSPKPHTDWQGAAVQILDGKGAGQYRFVAKNNGREWEVEQPWIVAPDESSIIAIAPFRGQNLFIGNSFEDGGAFQLYGAASDSIVAENKGARMDGFFVLGLNPHGWGHQPSWFCQFLDNEILEGNGYAYRGASLGTGGYDESGLFAGPMVRGAIFRRNVLRNNASIVIGGPTQDTLVENNLICNTDIGIRIIPSTSGTVLRGNIIEGTVKAVEGQK